MTRYLATISFPNCPPMNDESPVFETSQEAWDYLADERREHEDEMVMTGMDGHSETVDELDAKASVPANMLDGWDGTGTVYGSTPGYDGDHDPGLAYTVAIAEEES